MLNSIMVNMWILFLISLLSVNVESANILTIIPFPSYSHQQPLLAVSIELARRGHNLTVITTDPPKESIPNYKAIDVSSAYEVFATFGVQREFDAFTFVQVLGKLFGDICDHELSLPVVKEFIRTAKVNDYDLVILENLMYSSFGGIVHKIGSPPVVGIHTLPPLAPTDWSMNVPLNPSYMPDMWLGYTDQMDFFQRVQNTIFYWLIKYLTEMDIIALQEKILRKHFGNSPPSAREFEFNKSLVIMPADLSVTYPAPLPPNVIQVGALHVKKPKPLPKDLQDWIDGAEDGFVYFSLGSIMRGTSLREDKRDAFVKTFTKFPKIRFLWKYETDNLIPGLPNNVLIRKWFPQQDIVAHPKIRLIIFQGGLQTLGEILTYGTPVLGIPLFSDQRHNTWKMAKEGAGISMEIHEVTPDTIYDVVYRLLNENKYKENAKRLSRIANDTIVPAMDTAVWWIEYVIRHNGARHLRMASFDLTWYQYALIDVYAFFLFVILIIGYIIYFAITFIVSLLFINRKGKLKTK